MNISVVVHGDDGTVVDRLESHRGVLTVARTCAEIAEVIALCETGLADAAILAGPPEEVETHDIDAMIERGVPVVVLCDDAAQGKRLAAAGAYVAATGTPAAELGILVGRARAELGHREHAPEPVQPGEPAGGGTPKRAGIVVFWGPVGSPGRSLLALNYAVECALDGKDVVLLDADTYGASQAVQLGLLDEAAGIAQICRTVDSGRFDATKLERSCAPVVIAGARMRVATGLPRASRWPELRPTALRRAVLALQEGCDMIVIDVAAALELDEELSFDTAAPQRNGVTAAMLRIADEIYAVGAADSIGVPRLIRALEEMREVLGELEVKVLFNKVSAANVGASPRQALAETWARFGPDVPVAGYLPHDPAAVDAALLAGSALAEIAPHSGLRVAIAALAGHKIKAKMPLLRRFAPSM
ncbi:chromosome partitioning protein [Paeniglutamicibacter sp. ABSL32-1]|uniref:AAA family ATPase n=1 Tax=Paeniglutamicibacter quisquiliarum TaxID=2849498 RepID=UPI001C2CF5F0|nr:chromosome partitioning protein [Paeniglutamicibacter quisquiliarum]MBV1780387.1 chromosome partitioning protein [Paeniglutamicibacter quisquiliarum]